MRKPIDSLKTRAMMREWLMKHATITLACEPEDVPVRGNASSIDAATDRATEEWIERELRSGNQWAWCHVVVTVSFEGFSASDSLGCCSYENEAAFKVPGGYYEDMVRCCCTDLVAQLFNAREILNRVWDRTLG